MQCVQFSLKFTRTFADGTVEDATVPLGNSKEAAMAWFDYFRPGMAGCISGTPGTRNAPGKPMRRFVVSASELLEKNFTVTVKTA